MKCTWCGYLPARASDTRCTECGSSLPSIEALEVVLRLSRKASGLFVASWILSMVFVMAGRGGILPFLLLLAAPFEGSRLPGWVWLPWMALVAAILLGAGSLAASANRRTQVGLQIASVAALCCSVGTLVVIGAVAVSGGLLPLSYLSATPSLICGGLSVWYARRFLEMHRHIHAPPIQRIRLNRM